MKPIEDIPVSLYSEYFRTGSSVICSPPVLTTDVDVMIHTQNPAKLMTYLLDKDWETNYGDYPLEGDNLFRSFRLGVYNLLVTSNLEYFSKFEEATKVATRLNLKEKEDRIYIFNYIVNGEIG